MRIRADPDPKHWKIALPDNCFSSVVWAPDPSAATSWWALHWAQPLHPRQPLHPQAGSPSRCSQWDLPRRPNTEHRGPNPSAAASLRAVVHPLHPWVGESSQCSHSRCHTGLPDRHSCLHQPQNHCWPQAPLECPLRGQRRPPSQYHCWPEADGQLQPCKKTKVLVNSRRQTVMFNYYSAYLQCFGYKYKFN